MRTKFFLIIIIVQLVLIFTSCSSDTDNAIYIPLEERTGALPTSIIEPEDNLGSPEKITLGRILFWDPILSGNKDVACATCHHPEKGYTDQIDISLGVGGHGLAQNRTGGALVKRNAPSIINTAFNGIDENENYNPANTSIFWDNRSVSLEAQSLNPIKSMNEMRGNAYAEEVAIDSVVARLNNITEYRNLFNQAFGENTIINADKISKALAAFERTIIANNSPFDQYVRGDDTALNDLELRGFNAFKEAKCNVCHSGPMFSDFELHNLGLPHNPKLAEIDNGIDGKFRTPTLRNLPETGPFYHNGVFADLTAAVNFYDDMEVNDEDAAQLNFDDNPATVEAIVAFLRTLNDPNFDKTIPENVPSELPVGGNIQ